MRRPTRRSPCGWWPPGHRSPGVSGHTTNQLHDTWKCQGSTRHLDQSKDRTHDSSVFRGTAEGHKTWQQERTPHRMAWRKLMELDVAGAWVGTTHRTCQQNAMGAGKVWMRETGKEERVILEHEGGAHGASARGIDGRESGSQLCPGGNGEQGTPMRRGATTRARGGRSKRRRKPETWGA